MLATRMACGEGTRAYGNRMDNIWALRAAFAVARGFRDAQDTFCSRVEAGPWDESLTEARAGAYPEDYRWEALVEVLRGRVKVCTSLIRACFDGRGSRTEPFGVIIAGICAVQRGGRSGCHG